MIYYLDVQCVASATAKVNRNKKFVSLISHGWFSTIYIISRLTQVQLIHIGHITIRYSRLTITHHHHHGGNSASCYQSNRLVWRWLYVHLLSTRCKTNCSFFSLSIHIITVNVTCNVSILQISEQTKRQSWRRCNELWTWRMRSKKIFTCFYCLSFSHSVCARVDLLLQYGKKFIAVNKITLTISSKKKTIQLNVCVQLAKFLKLNSIFFIFSCLASSFNGFIIDFWICLI